MYYDQNIFREVFNFLITDYGFSLNTEVIEEWGYKIEYVNRDTGIGVKVTFENREAYIFVLLCRLVENEIIETPRIMDDKTILNNFSLDDIISLKEPSAIVKALYEYPTDSKYHDEKEGFFLYTKEFSENLKKYGSEILVGDFDNLLPKLDKIVRDRAKEYDQYIKK